MDYISFPEQVIYREREHLEDFDVKNTKSLNFILESELHKLYYTKPGYRSFALNILNTVYYICTMVNADDDPTRNYGDYLDIIEKKMKGSEDDVALVLSMVLIIIDAYKWNETKTDLGTFALQVFYEIEKHNHIRYAYYEQAKNHYELRADRTVLSPDSEFTRRPINYRLLADNYSVEDLKNLLGTDENKVKDFVRALGKDEEEQYTIVSFLEDQMHSFFPDGWRHKAFFDYIKSDIHKTFHGEEERAEMDAQIEEDLMKEYEQQWELDYYKDEYQKQKAEIATLRAEIEKIKGEVKDVDARHSITPEQFHAIFSDGDIPSKEENDNNEITIETPHAQETEVNQTRIMEMDSNRAETSNSETVQLQTRNKELQDALNEEKAKNAKLEEEIAILCEPVKELTATQNIRLAFALQLFRAAGLKDEKLDKRNRQLIKIANLLSLLLDIHSNNKKNNPAHTCAKWLSHREYVTSTNKEQIIELNKCFAELDWEFALSLENPKL